MKTLLTLFAAFAIVAARAQTAPTATATGEENFHGTVTRQPVDQRLLLYQPDRPNQIRSDHLVYEDILVELYKTDSPLQLFNPASTLDYATALDNAAIDQVNGEFLGWKFFSISF